MAARKFNALPGFGLTMGFTLVYLSVIVLIPIGGLIFKALGMSWTELWRLAGCDPAALGDAYLGGKQSGRATAVPRE